MSRADGVPLKIINFGLCTRAITLRLLETVSHIVSQFVCRDDCRTVVAPAFAAKNFRHLAGTKAKARWNATTTANATTATHGAAAAKWDPRRVGYYRSRFQEETACLQRSAM